jgi:hypothetical protein
MTYEELKNKDNYHTIGYGKNTKYFQHYTEAVEYIEENNLPHTFNSVWTDEMGYIQESVHTF